jgi:hypothetical protein
VPAVPSSLKDVDQRELDWREYAVSYFAQGNAVSRMIDIPFF